MALTEDEKELLRSVSEEVQDFYPPMLALALYRYDKINTPFGAPTEQFKKIAVDSFNDTNEFLNET